MKKLDRPYPLFDTSLNVAERLAHTFLRLSVEGGGSGRYKAAHAPRGTIRSHRIARYMSGYNPPMSGSGVGGDRLSHRLGRP